MKLALGTVQFGLAYGIANATGRVSLPEAGEILREALASGINTLDTAIAYGDSEQTLGSVGVADWQVVSKLPLLPDDVVDVTGWVAEQISGSLERLRIDRMYAVLLHRPEQLLGGRGKQLFEALAAIKSDGHVVKTGVSVYSPNELEKLFDGMHFDLVQAPLNILDRRIVESGWAQRLKNMGVELHTRSAFLQGLLLMPDATRPEKFNRWRPLWNEWAEWLRESGLSRLEACLRYVLSVDEVDKVVVGVDSVAHLQEILAASRGDFPGKPQWNNPIASELINPACWGHL